VQRDAAVISDLALSIPQKSHELAPKRNEMGLRETNEMTLLTWGKAV
jgi:hypothetical protein